MFSMTDSFRTRLGAPYLIVIAANLLVCSVACGVEPHPTLYKWDDASGHTHYTQTPPDAETPYQEISNLQIMPQHAELPLSGGDNTATQKGSSAYPPAEQTIATPPTEGSNFSSIPQNARVIPNKYHYGSTEYKVSPAKAAIQHSRNAD